MHAHQQPEHVTHAEPDADHLADLDAAERDALADRVRRAGAVVWAHRHGRHVADPDEQPGADDVPVADDGEHGDLDALRAAYDDACTRADRAAIGDLDALRAAYDDACTRADRAAIGVLSRRLAVHPDVHRPR